MPTLIWTVCFHGRFKGSFTRGSDYKTSTEKVLVVWISVRSLKVRMYLILNRLLQEQAKLAELQDKDPAAFPALPVGYFYIKLDYLQSAFSLKIPLVLIPVNAMQQLCTRITLFCTFLSRRCTTTT